jgi:hypothetical protein
MLNFVRCLFCIYSDGIIWFGPSSCEYGAVHLLICLYWTILAFQGWIPLHHGEWSIYLFIYFGGTGEWTQDFTLARQAYHLSHCTSPFCVGYFWDRSYFMPELVWNCDPPVCASQIGGTAGMWAHMQPLVEMRSHELFAQIGLELWLSPSLSPK